MEAQAGLRSRMRQSSWNPHTVGLVYAAIAFAFTTVHTLFILPRIFGSSTVAPHPVFAPLLGAAIAGNAYCWARFIWARTGPESGPRSYGDAAVTGAGIGLSSYLTVGAVYLATNVVVGLVTHPTTRVESFAQGGILETLGFLGTWSVLFSVYGFVFTFGIPVLLSVCGALFVVWATRTGVAH